MPIRTGRFLKYIRAGQGTEVPAGKKIVRRVPRIVAETLGLENPHRFTKSSFTNTRAVISVALKGLAITEDASGMLMSFFILMCSGQNTCWTCIVSYWRWTRPRNRGGVSLESSWTFVQPQSQGLLSSSQSTDDPFQLQFSDDEISLFSLLRFFPSSWRSPASPELWFFKHHIHNGLVVVIHSTAQRFTVVLLVFWRLVFQERYIFLQSRWSRNGSKEKWHKLSKQRMLAEQIHYRKSAQCWFSSIQRRWYPRDEDYQRKWPNDCGEQWMFWDCNFGNNQSRLDTLNQE